jgi:hypothetical protein
VHDALELTEEINDWMGGGFYVCAREQDGHGVQWFAVLNFFGKAMPLNSWQQI